MMAIVELILLAVAAVLFGLAAFELPMVSRWNLVAGGLLFWVLAEIFGRL